MEGIATAMTSWSMGLAKVTKPPRATVTKLARGATLGHPNDGDQQQRVLDATLALLGSDAPQALVILDEVDGEG